MVLLKLEINMVVKVIAITAALKMILMKNVVEKHVMLVIKIMLENDNFIL